MRRIIPALIVAGVLGMGASVPPDLTLGSPVSLPPVGVRFRAFRNMKPMPLPMPAIRASRSDGVKLMDNLEYWNFRQTAGIWSNGVAMLRVGTATLAPLAKRELKPEGELASSVKTLDNGLPEADEKMWMEQFAGAKVLSVKPYPESLYGCSAKVFELEEDSAVHQAAFLVTSRIDPTRVIALLFAIDKANYSERADVTIRQVLSSLQLVTPKRETVSLEERLRKKGTPEYEASRERVISSIRNFRDWWYVESDNYLFVSNESDRRAMARLRTDLEKAREVFSDYYPLKKPLASVSVVRIFATRDQYKEYVGEDMQWSGGLWAPSRRELIISPLDPGARESVREMIMRQVAFHEGFHQYLYFATGEAPAGMWFNEGSAQFFEGIEFQSGKGVVGLPQYIERSLVALFDRNKVHDIGALIKMDRETFYGANRDVNYPLSQALLYYLWKGAKVDGKPEYAEIPVRYYDTLVETRDPAAANEAAWKGVDVDQLSKDLSRFWNSSNLIRQSTRYQPPARKATE